MNDRFKFRVWWNSPFVNEESKYLYYNPNEFCHTTDIVRDASCDSVEDIVYYDIRDIILGDIDEFEKPNTFIVEQCTGLKDKNGNLIYEGDIVKCDRDFCGEGRVGLIRTVVFSDGAFQIQKINKEDRYYINAFHNFEVLGNIHESNKLWIHYELEQKDK